MGQVQLDTSAEAVNRINSTGGFYGFEVRYRNPSARIEVAINDPSGHQGAPQPAHRFFVSTPAQPKHYYYAPDIALSSAFQDPYFFDQDYTIAGSTGFLLWEANWLLLRLLRGAPSPSPAQPAARPTLHLGRLLRGRRVLELGSGTGLAGLCAAAAGAHVLLTDLASVCAGALAPNLQRNARAGGAGQAGAGAGAGTGGGGAGAADGAAEAGAEARVAESGAAALGRPWAGAVAVGQGSAAVMALDWTEPLGPQAREGGNDPRDADFILAVDTIWLLDILRCFIEVVLAVLRHTPSADPGPNADADPGSGPEVPAPPPPLVQRACFLAFVERAGADSKLFVRGGVVEQELRARGCVVEVLVAEEVDVDGVQRPGRVLRVVLGEEG
ncbi:hypothetical protein TSOC_013531, partial [Tetrabaena socialis]